MIKRETKIVEKEETKIVGYECDRCGKGYASDFWEEIQEFHHINFTGGYGSIFGDGTEVKCDLCQYCLHSLIKHIVIDKEHYKAEYRDVPNREGISIANEEIIEKSEEEIIKDIDYAFKKIESQDLAVDKILVSKEIKKIISSFSMFENIDNWKEEDKTLASSYGCEGLSGVFWTATVYVVEGLNEMIFLSVEKEDLKFEQRCKFINIRSNK